MANCTAMNQIFKAIWEEALLDMMSEQTFRWSWYDDYLFIDEGL